MSGFNAFNAFNTAPAPSFQQKPVKQSQSFSGFNNAAAAATAQQQQQQQQQPPAAASGFAAFNAAAAGGGGGGFSAFNAAAAQQQQRPASGGFGGFGGMSFGNFFTVNTKQPAAAKRDPPAGGMNSVGRASSFAASVPAPPPTPATEGPEGGEGGEAGGYRAPSAIENRGDPEALLSCMQEMLDDPTKGVDYWTSRRLPSGEWADGAKGAPSEKDAGSLVDVACRAKGYSVEVGAHSVRPGPLVGDATLDGEEEAPFFARFVKDLPHENYVIPEIPAVISVQTKGAYQPFCKAIVRTKRADRRAIVPFEHALKAACALIPGYKGQKATLVKKAAFDEDLKTYEEKEMPARTFKFGVLYVKRDQTDENEIFANTAEDASQDYNDFLDFLGDRIALKGWKKYRAGLDVTADNTGVTSVFTEHENGRYQIMYHVATMLPNQAIDEQKVERKRHIGNDVVVVVFKEQSGPDDRFDPRILTSHFNHCFFVFSVAERDANGKATHYKLTVANKPDVAPYQPYLYGDSVFEINDSFHRFVLIKRKKIHITNYFIFIIFLLLIFI